MGSSRNALGTWETRPVGTSLLAFLTVLVLVACSSAGNANASPSVSHTLTVAAPATIQILDPQNYAEATTGHTEFAGSYTSMLVRYKLLPASANRLPGVADMVGDLATSWTIASDGITFKLRLGAKSFAGNPLTAEDVLYSFQRGVAIKDPATTSFMQTAGIDFSNPITIIDSATVKLNAKVNASTMALLGGFFETDSILDSVEVKKHVTADDPLAKIWLKTNAASFAAYEPTTVVPTQELDLKANPNFYGPQPYFTKILIRSVPDSSVRLQLLASGSVMWAQNLAEHDALSLKGNSCCTYALYPSGTVALLHLSVAHNPKAFNDANVRQAISLAIDRKAFSAGPYAGLVQPAGAYFSVFEPDWPGAGQSLPELTYDPTKAKQLLAQSGYAPGSLTMVGEYAAGATIGPADASSVWLLLQQQLAAVGINLQLKVATVPSGDLTDMTNHTIDSVIIPAGGFANDAAYIANQLYSATAYNNVIFVGGFKDPAGDALVQQALYTTDATQRASVLGQLNSHLVAEAFPLIPIVENGALQAFAAGVCGYQSYPGGSYFWDMKAC